MKFVLPALSLMAACSIAHSATWECVDSTDGHVYRVSQDMQADKCVKIDSTLTASERETQELQKKILASTTKGMTPFIGMNMLEAVYSTWGAPDKRNKTTWASGVSEQWVYEGKGYLYFENGKIVEIQN